MVASLPRPKAFYIKFSPRGTYLMTWEIFVTTKDNPAGSPNMYIYRTETGEEVYATIQKRQMDWQPHWSNDESLIALMLNGELLFYEVNAATGFTKAAKRMSGGGRNGCISMAPNNGKPFLANSVPGSKGVPSMCKIYQYPIPDSNQPVNSKSFFQADKVDLFWNKKGTGLLILTSTEVDQSNNSYYGKQALHFMSTRGDSYSVQLSKEGPIHSVSWSPKSTEFCVIYGFMPAKASVFNLKCDAVHTFDESARNTIYYNTFGNILMLAGFGNLRGQVELYDVTGKEKRLIGTMQAPDTTLLEWHPNGEMFVTATTSPRLRMSNGFKVWHYSGALLHETMWPTGQELLEVTWQKMGGDVFKEQPISTAKIEGIVSAVPQVSSQSYRPPHARGIPNTFASFPSKPATQRLPPGMTADATNPKKKERRPNENNKNRTEAGEKKAANKKKGKKEGKQARPKNGSEEAHIEGIESVPTADTNGASDGSPVIDEVPKPKPAPRIQNHDQAATNNVEPENAKRIRNIKKKIGDIKVLKEKLGTGQALNQSQLDKIETEAKLVQELSSLRVRN